MNLVLPKEGDVTICAYDLEKFDSGIVIDVLRMHPMVLIGGIVQYNPFFVSPEEFLQELNERESPEAGSSPSAVVH